MLGLIPIWGKGNNSSERGKWQRHALMHRNSNLRRSMNNKTAVRSQNEITHHKAMQWALKKNWPT